MRFSSFLPKASKKLGNRIKKKMSKFINIIDTAKLEEE